MSPTAVILCNRSIIQLLPSW